MRAWRQAVSDPQTYSAVANTEIPTDSEKLSHTLTTLWAMQMQMHIWAIPIHLGPNMQGTFVLTVTTHAQASEDADANAQMGISNTSRT